eukprot:GHVU01173912.1.p1 GENE.GHVU01173912.1~~GHVU01173912.1.p1  ORF type:complete len:363 (+),score=78.42 GHVU01173912.1:547-1635(+)
MQDYSSCDSLETDFNNAAIGWQACSATNQRDSTANSGVNAAATYDGENDAESAPPLLPWVDWRNYEIISPVKDQGACGSCWAFSAIGAVEAHIALKKLRTNGNTPSPISLYSEQQLVDCSRSFLNEGCNGGLPSQAFEYVKYQGGVETEEEYPYQDGGLSDHPQHVCRYTDVYADEGFVVGGARNVTGGDEAALQMAVATRGPVTVAFQATADLKHYRSGVYSNPECGNTVDDVNHAVLVVGYGVEDGVPYWLVKNSWGQEWGDDGYFKIERGKNMCGIADCASYPWVYSSGEINAEEEKRRENEEVVVPLGVEPEPQRRKRSEGGDAVMMQEEEEATSKEGEETEEKEQEEWNPYMYIKTR